MGVYKFAHIGLVRGPKGTDGKYTVEDVHASGLIDIDNSGLLLINNKSGHFQIHKDYVLPSLSKIKEKFQSHGLSSIVDKPNLEPQN